MAGKEDMHLILTHTADREGRLSSFLRGEMKLSSSLMNKLKWGDAIQVNGRKEHTNYACVPGDVITVDLEEPEPQYEAQDGPLTILYEDPWLLAADKPAGMLIHPSRVKNQDTLANYVMGYYRRTGQNSLFHPLTRLDRDTFGVVLLAKNAYVHTLLQQTAVKKNLPRRYPGRPGESFRHHRSAHSQKASSQPSAGGKPGRQAFLHRISGAGAEKRTLQTFSPPGYRQDPPAAGPLCRLRLSHSGGSTVWFTGLCRTFCRAGS